MRVTIGELTEDYLPFTKEGNEATTIEVVPRKMVEKIIEKCERMMEFYTCDTDFVRGKKWAYDDIRAYAYDLLGQFEKEPEKHTCRNCKYFNTVDIQHCLYSCTLKHKAVFGFESCDGWEKRGQHERISL